MCESSSSVPRRSSRRLSSQSQVQMLLKKQRDSPIKKKQKFLTKTNNNNNRDIQNINETTTETEDMEILNKDTQPTVIIEDINNKGKGREIEKESGTFDTEPIENTNPLGGNVNESGWTYVSNKK